MLLLAATIALQLSGRMSQPIIPSPLAITVMEEGKKHGWVGHLPILGSFQGGQPKDPQYVFIDFDCGSHAVRIMVNPHQTAEQLKAASKMFRQSVKNSHRIISREAKLEGTGLFVAVLQDPAVKYGNGKTGADYSTCIYGIVNNSSVMFSTSPSQDFKVGKDKSLKDLYNDTVAMAEFVATQLKKG